MMAKPQIVLDKGDLCGESPVWDTRSQVLYWTDISGRKFQRYSPATGQYELLKRGVEINGIALREDGGFVITNSEGVWRWDGKSDPQEIVSEFDGRRLQLNDCISDPAGRLLSGTWHYDPAGNYPLGKLISVDVDGRVSILDEGIHGSNGLAFSLDQKTLYFTDTIARTIYAYDYDAGQGTVAARRVWAKVPDHEGLPDGMTVDADGFVWSAQWYGSCVVRYDPTGRLQRRVILPAKQISSLTFGGEELCDIYITSAGASEPMPVMPRGYDPFTGPFGGALYRINLGIRGRPEFRCRL
jgi:sugar lactone lactonase YvrE